MVEIVKVRSKKDIKKFLDFPLRLYKNCEYFAPPLYMDEKSVFTDKNVYAKTCESEFFLAIKDGKVAGRIHGIIQKQSNELRGEARARFTRFDSVNDEEVSSALFSALEKWAAEKGMTTVCGPLGFSDLEREGLLIDGFNEFSTFEEQYNFDYYPALVENSGYEKEVDWVEYQLRAPDEKTAEKISRIAEKTLKINKLHLLKVKNKSEIFNKYSDGIFHCLDECYKDLYGTVPFTAEMKKQMISQFKIMINEEYIAIILDENDNVAAFALCLPDIAKSLRKSGGKLTPAGLIRLLKAVKRPEIIDLALIAVLPEYQARGVNAVALDHVIRMLRSGKIAYLETNLNLETNEKVQSQWKYFDKRQHKRRRSYVKNLTGGGKK